MADFIYLIDYYMEIWQEEIHNNHDLVATFRHHILNNINQRNLELFVKSYNRYHWGLVHICHLLACPVQSKIRILYEKIFLGRLSLHFILIYSLVEGIWMSRDLLQVETSMWGPWSKSNHFSVSVLALMHISPSSLLKTSLFV